MATINPADSQSNRLCLACGMCCDGTLFATGSVQPGEAQRLTDTGFSLTPHETEGVRFLQPCPMLEGTACKAYPAGRPAVCGTFRCELLKRAEQGQIGFDAARELVAAAVTAAHNLQAAVGADSILAARKTARAWAEADLPDPRNGIAIVRYVALERYLSAHFRKPAHEPQDQQDLQD